MLVSGVSSPREMCLVGMGPAGALLDECTAALAELDGREVWTLTGRKSVWPRSLMQLLGVLLS